jgi:DNA-3-methyladenine glycosylase
MQLKNITNGPGKVVQAFGISMADYGNDLLDHRNQLFIENARSIDPAAIQQTPRVGINRGQDMAWRWRLIE